jgi:hypothetical protein
MTVSLVFNHIVCVREICCAVLKDFTAVQCKPFIQRDLYLHRICCHIATCFVLVLPRQDLNNQPHQCQADREKAQEITTSLWVHHSMAFVTVRICEGGVGPTILNAYLITVTTHDDGISSIYSSKKIRCFSNR